MSDGNNLGLKIKQKLFKKYQLWNLRQTKHVGTMHMFQSVKY